MACGTGGRSQDEHAYDQYFATGGNRRRQQLDTQVSLEFSDVCGLDNTSFLSIACGRV